MYWELIASNLSYYQKIITFNNNNKRKMFLINSKTLSPFKKNCRKKKCDRQMPLKKKFPPKISKAYFRKIISKLQRIKTPLSHPSNARLVDA